MEWTFAYTSSAVAAGFCSNPDLAIYDFCHLVGTGIFYGTFLTAFAFLCIYDRNTLSDNPHIIQIRFDTVIGTSAYCNLEFVGKHHITISFIKSVKDLFRQCIGIQQSILTGSSLTGYYGTHLRTSPTGNQTFLCNKFLKLFNLFIRNSLHFYRKSCGIGKHSIAIFFCCVCHKSVLRCSYLSVYCDNSCRKIVCAFVIKEAHSF